MGWRRRLGAIVAAGIALASAGCASCGRPRSEGPNLLVVVLDDVGTDSLGTWREHPDAPPTPSIDALAAQGVLFRNAWATPACSPSRATVMTGRHGRRTGIGAATHPWRGTYGLPLDEVTIPEALDLGPVDVAAFATGKWHLSARNVGGPRHPLLQGFDHFSGPLGNLLDNHANDGRPQDYYDWQRDVDGRLGRVRRYAPSVAVDDAIRRIDEAEGPWFAYVAFPSAHAPYQAPPDALLDAPLPEGASVVDTYRAMVRATDRELGRLLEHVDLTRTTVILVGDNGTPPEATTPPFDPKLAKETLAEGGIGIPFLVAGAAVSAKGAESAVPVHTTDILPTLAALAGVDPARLPELDGISLVPWLAHPDAPPTREAIYTEWFTPDGHDTPYTMWQAAVRDERFKLVLEGGGRERFFDLSGGPVETEDLLLAPSLAPEAAAALTRLRAFLAAEDARLGAR